MSKAVSAYCVRCDQWFPLDSRDAAELTQRDEVPCEVCGSPMRVAHPGPSAAEWLRSLFRRPKNGNRLSIRSDD